MTATTDILQDFRSTLRDLDACAVDILDSSPLARALYSSDASIYRVVPTAIARPRHIDELYEGGQEPLGAAGLSRQDSTGLLHRDGPGRRVLV